MKKKYEFINSWFEKFTVDYLKTWLDPSATSPQSGLGLFASFSSAVLPLVSLLLNARM